MLIDPRIFCWLASACFNADASQVSCLSYFKSLHEIASSIDAMLSGCEGQWTRRVFVVYPSTVEARHMPRETINYQGRAREREREREEEEDSRRARIDTFKSAHRLSRRIPMRTGPGPQYLTEFIRHC